MKYNIDTDPARFRKLAVNVFGVDPAGKNDKEIGLEGIEALRNFWDSIGAPKTLADYDIDDSEIGSMADKAVRFGPFGNFRKLDREDVVEIYKMAL